LQFCLFTNTFRAIEMSAGKEMLIVNDMLILESNNEFIEILTLSTTPSGAKTMKIVEFPSIEIKNQLILPEFSWLVSQSKLSMNMYFLTGYKNSSNFVQTVEIKSIIEADHKQRFEKLLLRGAFDEAENFALSCGLDLEPLHQARVKKLLIEIMNNKSHFSEDQFNALMKQLTNTKDQKFLVSLKSFGIPDRTSLTQFLEYLLKNIDTNEFPIETNEINELLLRLETLRLIDPYDTNLQWTKFLHNKVCRKLCRVH
jgi:kinetochore-associated protein 1